jgi:predicted dehydrogenase
MIEAFKAAGQKLFVAYYRRRLPRFMKAEELIKSGVLGRITSVTYRLNEPHHRKDAAWRIDAALAGAGHFLDVGSHALDLMDYLLGPLTDVSGVAANLGSPYSVEDVVALSFRTHSGALGAMTCNFASATRDDLLRITGLEGEVTFQVFGPDPLRCENGKGVATFDRPHPAHVGQPLIQTAVDDLLGRGECPSTGESARRTSQVMDRALEGYYGGRGDAFWKRSSTWPGRRA